MNGQNNNSGNNSSTVSPEIQQPERKSAVGDNSEVKVLRAQLELMEKYNERILNTIYWALGGVIAVVLVVAFLGWYSNFRVYKKDIEALSKEVEALSVKKISVLRDELKSLSKEQQTTLSENLGKKLNSEMSIYNSRLDSIDYLWKAMNVTMNELSAKYWEDKKVYINAITSNLRKVSDASELGWKDSAISALREMERLLEIREAEIKEQNKKPYAVLFPASKNQTSINSETTLDITKVLDNLPSEYNYDTEKIYKLLGVTRNKATSKLLPNLPVPTIQPQQKSTEDEGINKENK